MLTHWRAIYLFVCHRDSRSDGVDSSILLGIGVGHLIPAGIGVTPVQCVAAGIRPLVLAVCKEAPAHPAPIPGRRAPTKKTICP